MTDNNIIKALECHKSKSLVDCERCPLYAKKVGFQNCHTELFDCVFDLINRQKAEIERLTINMNAFGLGMKREAERANTARADAVKEFAERLKARLFYTTIHPNGVLHLECINVKPEHIDNIVKEMVGEG